MGTLVHHHTNLITAFNQQLIDLANMLNISTKYIHPQTEYLYISFLSNYDTQPALHPQIGMQENDVVISSEVFTEILIDVASGIHLKDALLKRNILISS